MTLFTFAVSSIATIVGFLNYVFTSVYSIFLHGTNDEIKRLLMALACVYIGLLIISRAVRAIYGTVVLTIKIALVLLLVNIGYVAWSEGPARVLEWFESIWASAESSIQGTQFIQFDQLSAFAKSATAGWTN